MRLYIKAFILLTILLTDFTLAQIDTSVWYPMAKGNYWEYQDAGVFVRKGISVIGDTVMTNGKKYAIFRTEDLISHYINYSFRRVDSNSYLYIWNGARESKYYDFTKNLLESWRMEPWLIRRVVKKDSSFIPLFGSSVPRLEFENINTMVPSGDTIYIEREWQQVYKGIGDQKLGYSGGYIELVGAIINGQTYGNITSVKEDNNIPQLYILYQNYPNPFNPVTAIKYFIPEEARVIISVSNILGQSVAELVNDKKPPGYYYIKWNAADYPSGVYFYKLYALPLNKGKIITDIKKMILLK